MNAPQATNPVTPRITKAELCAVVLILAAYVGVQLLTIPWYPFVHIDEVMHSDPAVNWYLGKGFTSTAWFTQPKEQTWMSNSPGNALALCVWLEVFGWSMTTVRMMNVVLVAAGGFLLWAAAARRAWVKTPFCRLLLIVVPLATPALVLTAREARYDGVTFLWAALAFFVASYESPRKRAIGFFLLGGVLPLAGIQLVPFAGVMSIAAMIAFGWRRTWREILLAGAGSVVGLALFLAVLHLLGLAYVFLAGTFASQNTIIGVIAQSLLLKNTEPVVNTITLGTRLLGLLSAYVRDSTYPIFAAVLTVYVLLRWARGKLSRSSLPVVGLIAGLLMPISVSSAGKFPHYYTWMAVVPVAIGAVAALDGFFVARRRRLQVAGVAVFAAALLWGVLPLVTHVWLNKPVYEYAPIRALAARNITSRDVVMADWASYYAVKPLAKEIYLCGRVGDLCYSGGKLFPDMRDEEKQSVSLLIIRPETLTHMCAKIGGQWEEVDTGYDAGEFRGGPWLTGLLRVPQLHPFEFRLRVYRRKASDGAGATHRSPG